MNKNISVKQRRLDYHHLMVPKANFICWQMAFFVHERTKIIVGSVKHIATLQDSAKKEKTSYFLDIV
jgi:hypothetical protein